MMKNIKSKILLIAMAVPLLFAACKLNVNPIPEKEEGPRFVTIYPSLNLEARTIMPDFSGITLEKLTYTVTVGYMDGKWSETVIYSQNYDTLMQGFKVPEGNIYVDLSGKDSSTNITFRDRLENVEVVYGQTKELSFVLHPEKYDYSYSYRTVNFTLDFDFPADSNPVFSSGALKYYQNGGIYTPTKLSSSNVTVTTTEATDDNPAHPHMKITFSGNCYVTDYYQYTYDYFVEITFNNEDDEGNVIGMYKYNSAVIFGNNSISSSVSEHVDVKKFANVYTITYHLSNGTTETAIYSPAYGFNLYSPADYTWFTDERCTIKATGEVGSCSGDIDLYSSDETNTHNIYFCDMEGNPIKIKTTGDEPSELDFVALKNKTTATFYKGASERLVANGLTYNILKEGYYVNAVYKDKQKNNTICDTASTSGTIPALSNDLTLYVEYAQKPTVKVVDMNNTENVLGEINLCSRVYRLENTYLRDGYYSNDPYVYYSDDKTLSVYRYYSSLEDVDSVIETGKSISVAGDVTIVYADIEVPHTLTIVDIDAEDITSNEAVIATMAIKWRQYTLTYNKVSTYGGTNVPLPTDVRILHYYSDVGRTQEVEVDTKITEVNEDVTLYAQVDKTHTLKIVDIDAEDITSNAAVIMTMQIVMEQYTLIYNKLSTFNNSSVSLPTNVNVLHYYSDVEGTQEVEMNTTVTDAGADVTLYAKKDVPHKLTVYEMNDLTTKVLEMDIVMQTLKVSGNYLYTKFGSSSKSVSGETVYAFYYVDENDEYQPLENNHEYTGIAKDVTLYARRNRTVVLKDTNAATDPWTSTTGIYEYEVEEDASYTISVKDSTSPNDNHFLVWINGIYEYDRDADSGNSDTYNLKQGDRIKVKIVPHSNYSSYKNDQPIENFSKDPNDYIRISKKVLDTLPTSSSGSSE